MTKGTSIAISFLGGFAAGISIGILYAPDSGKNTRDKISRRLKQYYDQLKDVVEEKTQLFERSDTHSSFKEQEDYRKAQELLGEVENILDELKGNNDGNESL